MQDLISRQEAIDKINEQQRKLIYCFGFENDMVKIMNIAKSIITAMPSTQPSDDYNRGWEDGQNALREEQWENGRDRLD